MAAIIQPRTAGRFLRESFRLFSFAGHDMTVFAQELPTIAPPNGEDTGTYALYVLGMVVVVVVGAFLFYLHKERQASVIERAEERESRERMVTTVTECVNGSTAATAKTQVVVERAINVLDKHETVLEKYTHALEESWGTSGKSQT